MQSSVGRFRKAQVIELEEFPSEILQRSCKAFVIYADVAQLAEQLICNQQVIGSSPIIGFPKQKGRMDL